MDPVATAAIRRAHAALEVALQPESVAIAKYAQYCGPRALAAVLGTAPNFAAAALLGVKRERGATYEPGTSVEDLVLALDAADIRAETFDVSTGQRSHDASETLSRARAKEPNGTPVSLDEVRDLIDQWAPDSEQDRERLWAQFHGRKDDAPRLESWLSKPGIWLIVVALDGSRHWVLVRDHRVVVGEDVSGQHSNRHMTAALRVVE
jgi:hypothetical protein